MHGKKPFIALATAVLTYSVILFAMDTRAAAQEERVLHSFSGAGTDLPVAGLILDAAGNLYGTTPYSGKENVGVVFELSPKTGGGWAEKVLHTFSYGSPADFRSFSSLIFDEHGNLYGTSYNGGVYGCGTVYELSPTTRGPWTEKVLHNFNDDGEDGCHPYAGLIFDSAGNLYSTTQTGGSHGEGTAFELIPQTGGGWAEKILHNFNNNGTDGYTPNGGLLIDPTGNLYGGTYSGGAYSDGAAFELTPKTNGGWTEKILYSFYWGKGVNGGGPGGFVRDTQGNLYGATSLGGTTFSGAVFELSPAPGSSWTETILYNFDIYDTGSSTNGSLIFDDAGNLYGTNVFGGAGSAVCLMFGGGTESASCGTVFKLTQAGGAWEETTLHSFGNGRDGQMPSAGLVRDALGSLFGTTSSGGASGLGTVFEIRP